MHSREIVTLSGFSLAETIAPIAWGGGRWPSADWIDGELISVANEQGDCVIRLVRQPDVSSAKLLLKTNRPNLDHQAWADRVLGVRREAPQINDPVVRSETIAPIAWGGGRWPSADWIDGELISVANEQGDCVIRLVRQPDVSSAKLLLKTNRPNLDHQAWADRVLGVRREAPQINDPVV